MEYLFSRFVKLEKILSAKNIILFLDYDGTLTPIVETPDKAALDQETRDLLRRLSESKGLKLALISGRSLNNLKDKVGLKNIIYSGNHGLEIEGPKIKFRSFIPRQYRQIIQKTKSDLCDRLSSVKGILLEDKGLSLSLHYRRAEKKAIPQINRVFHEITLPYASRNKIKVKEGKMVFEIRPAVKWDKGKAVLWLLSRQRFIAKMNKVFPVYMGDDITDEDAFMALKNKGMTVYVGKPKDSCAKYYLKNTDEVKVFLKKITELNNG